MREFPILFLSLLAGIPTIAFAQSALNNNLIANGGADSGPAGTSISAAVTNIPGWTIALGAANILPYDVKGQLLSTGPAPADHSFQYFVGTNGPTTKLTQDIDVLSAASVINSGSVKYTLSGYLGIQATALQ